MGPEALAGGPLGKVRDGDVIRIEIDRNSNTGSVNLVGGGREAFSPEEGERRLEARLPREDLAPHSALPDETRLWASLQAASGGTWGGCVYDVDAIQKRIDQAG